MRAWCRVWGCCTARTYSASRRCCPSGSTHCGHLRRTHQFTTHTILHPFRPCVNVESVCTGGTTTLVGSVCIACADEVSSENSNVGARNSPPHRCPSGMTTVADAHSWGQETSSSLHQEFTGELTRPFIKRQHDNVTVEFRLLAPPKRHA